MSTKKSAFSPLQDINLTAKVADLQELHYQNTLLLHAIIELLTEKGHLTSEELITKAQSIDAEMNRQLSQISRIGDVARYPS